MRVTDIAEGNSQFSIVNYKLNTASPRRLCKSNEYGHSISLGWTRTGQIGSYFQRELRVEPHSLANQMFNTEQKSQRDWDSGYCKYGSGFPADWRGLKARIGRRLLFERGSGGSSGLKGLSRFT
jgi:hypothetical protein